MASTRLERASARSDERLDQNLGELERIADAVVEGGSMFIPFGFKDGNERSVRGARGFREGWEPDFYLSRHCILEFRAVAL